MPQNQRVTVDDDGETILVYDGGIIRLLDEAFHKQVQGGLISVEEQGLLGIKLKFATTAASESDPGILSSHQVNSLCKC